MFYDRVLPNPGSLKYETPSVSTMPRPRDDHSPNSCMDLPLSTVTGRMPAAADVASYTYDLSSQTHQHPGSYSDTRGCMKNDSALSPVQGQAKPSPLISTNNLATDRSGSTLGSSCLVKSAKNEGVQFCLCQSEPKIPRPRNRELMLSELSLYKHVKYPLLLKSSAFCHG